MKFNGKAIGKRVPKTTICFFPLAKDICTQDTRLLLTMTNSWRITVLLLLAFLASPAICEYEVPMQKAMPPLMDPIP
jgi:hypothetical protein